MELTVLNAVCAKRGRMQLLGSFVNISAHGVRLVNAENLPRGRA